MESPNSSDHLSKVSLIEEEETQVPEKEVSHDRWEKLRSQQTRAISTSRNSKPFS